MNTLFSLDGRLSVCASYVRKGTSLADVGTDHAYLPIWLAKNGLISSAVASDIRIKPLKAGEENIKKYGVEDIVKTRLCGGLDEVEPEEADDIVIAGMGGEMIVKIIDNASWLKNSEKRLILQPMTKMHELRSYLCENGFEIKSETPCTHGGKYYTVICAEYSGETMSFSPSFAYIGKLENNSEYAREYMRSVLSKLHKKRDGTAVSGGDTGEMDAVIKEIREKFGI